MDWQKVLLAGMTPYSASDSEIRQRFRLAEIKVMYAGTQHYVLLPSRRKRCRQSGSNRRSRAFLKRTKASNFYPFTNTCLLTNRDRRHSSVGERVPEEQVGQRHICHPLVVMTVLRQYGGSLVKGSGVLVDRLVSHLSCMQSIGPVSQYEYDPEVPLLVVHNFT